MFDTICATAAEILKRREVDRIVYFHCDHFEPWIYDPQLGRSIHERNRRNIELFAELTGRIDYARRLTLFYKPIVVAVPAERGGLAQVPGDGIGFKPLSDQDAKLSGDAMQALARNSRHEFQVHFHHESYIGNRKYSLGGQFDDFMRSANTPALDRARWDLGLSLNLDRIVADTGLDRTRWFFIHGLWALNASDPDVCTITDEIARLGQRGCLGDFTFPAGRVHCTPQTQHEPYFVNPLDAPKGYDLPEAAPEPAWGNGAARQRGKFFIWANQLGPGGASLDYHSTQFKKRARQIDHWVAEILEGCVVRGGTLYWKTHAHSMTPGYVMEARLPVFPHQHPATQELFAIIRAAAANIGANMEFLSVSEVYDEYVAGGAKAVHEPAGALLAVPQMAAPPAIPVAMPSHAHADHAAPVMDLVTPPELRAITTPALPFATLAARVNADGLATLVERISRLGERESGAFHYYRAMSEQGQFLRPYEVTLADYLLANFGPERPMVEIGCGLGALPMLLAACGQPAIGVERQPQRAAGAHAIAAALAPLHTGIAARLTLLDGAYPEDVEAFLPADAVLVCTDTTVAMTDEAMEALMRAMLRCHALVFDPHRFFISRKSAEEVAALFDRFEALGFDRPHPVIDGATERERFHRTARRAAADARPAPAEKPRREHGAAPEEAPLVAWLPPPYVPIAGRKYGVSVPPQLNNPEPDSDLLPTVSRLVVFEDGVPLRQAHAPDMAVARDGAGAYLHRRDMLWFSTSDNSDPDHNGRAYAVAVGPRRPLLIAFGAGQVHGMAASLAARGIADLVAHGALAHSTGEMLQFIALCREELLLPRAFAPYVLPGTALAMIGSHLLDRAEGVLLDLCSADDIRLHGYTLNRALVEERLVRPLQAADEASRQAVTAWWHGGVLAGNEETRVAAGLMLLELMADADDAALLQRDIVRHATCVRQTADAVRDGIAALRDALGVPLCVLGHGAPDMVSTLRAACAQLALPLVEPAQLVARVGTRFAWNSEGDTTPHFNARMGDLLFSAWRDAAG